MKLKLSTPHPQDAKRGMAVPAMGQQSTGKDAQATAEHGRDIQATEEHG